MHHLPKTFLLLAGGIFLSLLIAGNFTPKQSLHTFIQFADQRVGKVLWGGRGDM
jgi:hypothetical protein